MHGLCKLTSASAFGLVCEERSNDNMTTDDTLEHGCGFSERTQGTFLDSLVHGRAWEIEVEMAVDRSGMLVEVLFSIIASASLASSYAS